MNTQIKFSAFVLTLCFQLISTFVSAQDIIDIVDPYEMKVSRSKDADTFYFSQNATTALAAKQKLDTLRTYDVFLEERPTPFGTAYMCNGNEVTKQKYFEYKKRKSIPTNRDGEIELLTASCARTILTRACTSILTSTVSHSKNSEEIKYLWYITYTWGIGILFRTKQKANKNISLHPDAAFFDVFQSNLPE